MGSMLPYIAAPWILWDIYIYVYANIDWGYIDGIHVTINIAAPWIRHGDS